MINNKNILSKEGYLLHKKNNINLIDKIKDELTVTPYLTFNINVKPESFPVYLENDKYLCVPKYYGLKNFGEPYKNKEILGSFANIEFKGNLRTEQLIIMDKCVDKLESSDGGLLSLGCGQGKCLAKNTKILLYDGEIINVQDIKIGDKIMGDDSKPRNIISLARGRETMYKVITGKTSSYIVNESHILSLQYEFMNKKIDISVLDYLNKKHDDQLYGYRVPIIFLEKKLTIDPYIIGYLLGSIKNIDVDIKSIIKNHHLTNSRIIDNSIDEFINMNNIINDIHIPNQYKCNSRKNQLKLLAGIIDSTGYIINDYYEIKLNNNKLIDDVIYLARSLGFLAIKNTNIFEDIINISGFGLEMIPILYQEKKIHIKQIDYSLRYKISLIKLEVDDYYGFEIDGNRRFVLGDFTVTHNTVLALSIAAHFKVKTLVIVHKSFLLNQWILRATEFTNAKIGIIQRDKIDIDGKDIVIGMLQSIAKDRYDSEIFRDFGLVIFDEAHHAPTKYFSKVLPIIACKKTLALSATPTRVDKLEKVLYWYFGEIIYKAPTEIINNVLVKVIKYNITHPDFREFKQNFGRDINRPKTINKIIKIDKRNKFIIDMLIEILKEENRKVLFLSDRVEHLTILKKSLDVDILSSFYIGGLKQVILDEAEKAQVIFATYSMAAEALDIPDLNTLLMVTPRKEVEQAVGRITRKKNHPVQPLIIDIVDCLPSFVKQGLYRRKFYNKKGFSIKLLDVNENNIINECDEVINKEQNVIDDNNEDFIDDNNEDFID
jgi:superfamily II DNA or RNA helicase